MGAGFTVSSVSINGIPETESVPLNCLELPKFPQNTFETVCSEKSLYMQSLSETEPKANAHGDTQLVPHLINYFPSIVNLPDRFNHALAHEQLQQKM